MNLKFKITWTRIWLILWLVSIYVLPLYIRYGVFPQSLAVWNILGAVSVFGFSWKYLKKRKTYTKPRFLLWLALVFLAYFTQLLRRVNISNDILVFVNFFIPILPLAFDCKLDIKDADCIRKSTNCVCILQIMAYIFKLVTGTSFSKLLGSAIGSMQLVQLAERPIAEYRFCSWMGHELSVCGIFIICFALNVIYYKIMENKLPPYYYALLSAVGVAITASKSGLLVYFTLFAFAYISKIKYAIGAVVLAVFALNSGIFDFVFSRFLEGSLSTNRIETLQYLLDNRMVSFSLFTGRGSQALVNLSRYGSGLTAGFEFIILIYALEYGIIFAALLVAYMMVFQLYDIWKLSGKWIVALAAVCVVAYYNGYNALGIYHDEMFLYTIATLAMRSYSFESAKK